MTILYFCVSGLDVLGLLEDSLSADEAGHIIKWVLSSHIIPFPYASTPAAFPLGDLPEGSLVAHCGFRSGPWAGEPFVGQPNGPQHPFDVAHIAMTYSALCVLQILTTAHFRRDPTGSSPSPIGKSLPELVDVPAICGALRALQLPNGWSAMAALTCLNPLHSADQLPGGVSIGRERHSLCLLRMCYLDPPRRLERC